MLRASPPYASVLGFKVYPTLLGDEAWRYCGRGFENALQTAQPHRIRLLNNRLY